MNRSILALAAVAVSAIIVGETRAQDELGKVDVAAVKKIQFIEKGKD